MMLKHFLFLCTLAGFLSVGYSCRNSNRRNSENGGSNGNGGNGDKQQKFIFDFQTYDVNGDGVITLAEFLFLQPEHEQLFHNADTDGNGELTCSEFEREVEKLGGKAIC